MELTFAYQAKFMTYGNMDLKIFGYEALLRVKNIDGSILTPESLIYLNRNNPLFDYQIILLLVKESNQYKDIFINVNLSLNISPIFLETLTSSEIEALSQIKCKELELEILESEKFSNYELVNSNISSLRKKIKGVKITLDDFGKDYSCYERLIKLDKVDCIKIDKEIVSLVLDNPKAIKLIKSLIDNTSCKIIAEGVEDIQVLDLLNSIGVQYYQGYLMSKPSLEPYPISF
ncbi:EAL domain-containing protein [Vibrio sp. Y29_XK_CS5]|uniref:EAL domain-containing protein n=1 Tax=Vibrio sp. Y29_XK_CS5 TaxID=2957762 RepID=UPI0020A36478|nr:EAL domain-containing protein [Vibrio sp. Y29_XK_CS5]